MGESQTALELRKFFSPFDPGLKDEEQDARDFNANIRDDGALCAFAETVLWRLRGVRAMVSLIDRTTQYFLAGVARGLQDELELDGKWFGCSTVSTPGGLCENTIAIDGNKDDYPCFEVLDLSADPRFANLPVVNGSIESYRFYAGAPIVTENKTNIGSIFIFDRSCRPEGLSYLERKWLNQSAVNVMRHLETKREAAERRRAKLMSRGIAQFLELTSNETEDYENDLDATLPSYPVSRSQSLSGHLINAEDGPVHREDADDQSTSAKILDKIRLTLNHASKILRDSLELRNGGVVFFDTALGYAENAAPDDYFTSSTEFDAEFEDFSPCEGSLARGGISPGHVRTSNDKHRPAKVLAMSATAWNPGSHIVDGKTLQSLTKNYPKGNIWYIDEKGFFSSLEQENELQSLETRSTPTEQRRSDSRTSNLNRKRIEAEILSKVFNKARQIIFLPLWDVAGKQWYSGCFVWSQSAVPVFTVESDIAYLLAFTNSVMVEISRLDAITANKMKSNFISSISHEFRSPLHGILAGSDFLRETELDSIQTEFVSTIQNCGSTLLDTINHVLDYSKINSFEKKSEDASSLSNGLYENCNIALLCEDIVSGMMAAKEFKGANAGSPPPERLEQKKLDGSGLVDIILDFEQRDWNYRVQPGALRRIIMNLFGNAHKFTHAGFIHVRLRVRSPDSPRQRSLIMNIMDSGIGMSTEYMQRRLYTPFAQEDAFSTGVGLGLSIVSSIVMQLEGKIHIRSEQGKGTDVEIVLPLNDVDKVSDESMSEKAHIAITRALEAQTCLANLKNVARNKTITVWQPEMPVDGVNKSTLKSSSRILLEHCVKTYLHDWFGFKVLPPSMPPAKADIVVQPYDDYYALSCSSITQTEPLILLFRDRMPQSSERRSQKSRKGSSTDFLSLHGNVNSTKNTELIRTVYLPLGPFKLAAALLGLLHSLDQATQNGSPEDCHAEHSTQSESANVFESGVTATELIDSRKPTSLNEGSNFKTEAIPLRPAPTHSKAISASADLPPSTVSLSILAVDDNDLNLKLLYRYLLKRPGGAFDRVVLARNGVEAVELFRTEGSLEATKGDGSSENFDVVFMDISMPLMDGFEATRWIRGMEAKKAYRNSRAFLEAAPTLKFDTGSNANGTGTTEEVKSWDYGNNGTEGVISDGIANLGKRSYIVALTGLGSKRDRDEARECGIDEFLTKPVGFVRIGEILGRLGREKQRARGGFL